MKKYSRLIDVMMAYTLYKNKINPHFQLLTTPKTQPNHPVDVYRHTI